MTTIDVHAHCIPESFRSWLADKGADVGASPVEKPGGTAVDYLGQRTSAPMPPTATGVERRLAEMDRMGIDVQVMAGWIDLTGYELEGDKAVIYSRAHNDELAAEAATNPDRFVAIGTVPLQSPDAAVAELGRCMGELGMKGVELATTVRGRALDQCDLDPFWEAAEESGAFILLHPMTPLIGVDLDRYFMSNMVGRPAESTITLAGLIFSGVLERFPSLKICVVHGGGFAPFQIGRLDRGATVLPDKVAPNISKLPSEYLKRLFVDTVVHDPMALDYLVRYFGAGQIMLGTDYPFPMGDLDPVTFIRSAGLADGDVNAILGETAGRLLGLE
jgi:aminocarboxymuconate-semialdehyde decarboxylase